MVELTEMRREQLMKDTRPCSFQLANTHYVSAKDAPFTYEDVAALQDKYYGSNGNLLHMSDVPGWICVKSLGEIENRKRADAIKESCSKEVLTDPEGKKKCNALYEIVNDYARESRLRWTSKYIGGGLLGYAGLEVVFGPSHFLRWAAKGGANLLSRAGIPGKVAAATLVISAGLLASSSSEASEKSDAAGLPLCTDKKAIAAAHEAGVSKVSCRMPKPVGFDKFMDLLGDTIPTLMPVGGSEAQ
ncbi:MAG: hypothetical protein V2A66_05540 [Pseudomonadota bacterium]